MSNNIYACGEHSIMYGVAELLSCNSETKVILCQLYSNLKIIKELNTYD